MKHEAMPYEKECVKVMGKEAKQAVLKRLTKAHCSKRTPDIQSPWSKGKADWLWDAQGNKYLDFMAGLAVTNLGHAL